MPGWVRQLSGGVACSRTISQMLACFVVLVLFICSIAGMVRQSVIIKLNAGIMYNYEK